jgi:hypothetical protein
MGHVAALVAMRSGEVERFDAKFRLNPDTQAASKRLQPIIAAGIGSGSAKLDEVIIALAHDAGAWTAEVHGVEYRLDLSQAMNQHGAVAGVLVEAKI